MISIAWVVKELGGWLVGELKAPNHVDDGERAMVRKKRPSNGGRKLRRMEEKGKDGGNKGDGWTEAWKEGYLE